jgi:transposase
MQTNTTAINPSAENDQSKINHIQNLNTQVKAVKPKVVRRKFNTAEKLKIIEEFDACNNSSDRGAFLRKQGLYYSGIVKWRRELSGKNSNHANSKTYKLTLAHNQIMRENVALKKKLAQAEAIIDLQKKVSELLSVHILDQKMSEE